MASNFLTNNQLLLIEELHYMLFALIQEQKASSLTELSERCKERSFNFAFAFDNTINFLQAIGLITLGKENKITRVPVSGKTSLTEEDLTKLLLEKTIAYLKNESLLGSVLPDGTIARDEAGHLMIYCKTIPSGFPFLKAFFLNMRLAKLSRQSNDILVCEKQFETLLLGEEQLKSKASGETKSQNFFISYSHKDEHFKIELRKHMSGLEQMGVIKSWNGQEILPGQDWDAEIKQQLEEADVVLFLVSADFMASEYINDVELKKAMERHNEGLLKIIPIIVRECDFKSLPISKYQALPKGARAIASFENQDAAYLDIVTQIKKIIA